MDELSGLFYMQMCLSGDGGGNELHTISKHQSFLFCTEKLHLCPRGLKVIGSEAADRKVWHHVTWLWPLTPSWSPNRILSEVFEGWQTGAADIQHFLHSFQWFSSCVSNVMISNSSMSSLSETRTVSFLQDTKTNILAPLNNNYTQQHTGLTKIAFFIQDHTGNYSNKSNQSQDSSHCSSDRRSTSRFRWKVIDVWNTDTSFRLRSLSVICCCLLLRCRFEATVMMESVIWQQWCGAATGGQWEGTALKLFISATIQWCSGGDRCSASSGLQSWATCDMLA